MVRPETVESDIRFHRERFLAAIHHVVDSCSEQPQALGKTKLHKCLYYADMLRFFASGTPLTGVEYIKSPYGPVARYLDWGLSVLESRNLIRTCIESYFGLSKYHFEVLQPAATNILSAEEKAFVDEIVAFVCKHSARGISEYSHAQPWQDVAMWAQIPYSSAFQLVPDTHPTRADLDWARDQREVFLKHRSA